MDSQEKRCIKAEHVSLNEAAPENKGKPNDFDEVSPSATDDGANDTWNTSKCILCNKTTLRYEEVKLLECLHSACSECVNARLNESGDNAFIVCNICQIPSSSLINNHFLMECNLPVSEPSVQVNGDNSRLTNVKCTSCHDNLIASSWCVDCNDFLCDGCVQAHQRLKITKDHTIKPKEEADLENNSHSVADSKLRTVSCPLHPQERLSLFCETCDKLTCRDCQLTEHRQHKYKFIDEIATETRRNINNLLTEVNYKRGLLKTAMRVIDDRQQQIINKKKELLNEITQMVVRLTEAFTTRGKHLVNKLNEICDSKQKTLNEKKVALEQLSLLTDHCIDFISHALDKGNDMAVLKTKNVMLKHLQIVKSKRADIPNPEIPVRIQLALDKANEICQMVNRLGVIIVDGRQHTPTVSPTPPTNLTPKPHGSMSHAMSQPMNIANSNQLFVAPPGYPPNNNMMNNNAIRTHPIQMSVQNVRTNNTRPHYPNATMHYAANNNQMKNVSFSGYQQQVTSSTHPQNSLYNGANASYDQGLRKLLMDKPNVAHTMTHPGMRSMMAPMNVVYQNADTNSINRVQSVSPQGVPVQHSKIQYLPNVNKMYQQPYPPNSMQMMPTQQCRSNMVSPGARQILSRENSLSPCPQQTLQWHTPQISANTSMKQMPALINVNAHSSNDDSFKIVLPSSRLKPSVTPPSIGVSVSSSVSKTPSPLNQGKSSPEEAEKNLDKVGQDSVNELMATIARLDSNGIKVIPEPTRKPGDSPLVDSSTGPPTDLLATVRTADVSITNTPSVVTEPQKGCDDPNEDWCAVCMDGGELVCCDNCPKVFHMNCHIPPLPILPGENDSWQCMLCTNINDYAAIITAGKDDKPAGGGLSEHERKIAERMLLELYCQYDPSLAFRDVVNPEMVDYYEKIKKPMCLDMIRRKLLKTSPNPYNSLSEIIRDVFLVFHNAYVYNEEGSPVYNDAKFLEDFLNQMLTKWLPVYAFDDSLRVFDVEKGDEDDDDNTDGPPSKRCKRQLSDE